jgi:hypothetical protein
MIRSATNEEISFIAGKISYGPSAGCKGVVFDDLRAGCLYDHWTPNSSNVHIYSRSPRALLSFQFVKAIFSYPFEQARLGLLIGITPADNEASLSFSRAIGFREVHRIRDGWRDGVDLVIKEIRREECRYVDQSPVVVQQAHDGSSRRGEPGRPRSLYASDPSSPNVRTRGYDSEHDPERRSASHGSAADTTSRRDGTEQPRRLQSVPKTRPSRISGTWGD